MMNSFLDKAVVPINTLPEQKAMKMNTGGALTKDDMLSTPPPMFMNFGGGLPTYQTLDYTQMNGKEVVPFTKEYPVQKNMGIESITTEPKKPEVNVNIPQIIQANAGVMSLPFNVQRPISAGLSDIKFMNLGGSAGNTGLMGLMSNTKYDI